MTKVFIDGKAGTTGLRIYERIGARKDIQLFSLSEELRKDTEARREALNSVDVVFCAFRTPPPARPFQWSRTKMCES